MVLDGCSLGLMAVVALTVTAILALTDRCETCEWRHRSSRSAARTGRAAALATRRRFALTRSRRDRGSVWLTYEFALHRDEGDLFTDKPFKLREPLLEAVTRLAFGSGPAGEHHLGVDVLGVLGPGLGLARRLDSAPSALAPHEPGRTTEARQIPDRHQLALMGHRPDPTGPAAHEVRRGLHRDHACRQVGELARPVSTVAAELGVCWWRVMNAVVEHGPRWSTTPTASVRWPSSASTRPRSWSPTATTTACTSPAWSIEAKVVIDMGEGNRAADLGRWTAKADPAWLDGVEVVATDLAESERDSRPISITPAGWRIRSTWSSLATAAWTRCGAGCRTRRSATEDARPTAVSDPQDVACRHERLDQAGHQRMLWASGG